MALLSFALLVPASFTGADHSLIKKSTATAKIESRTYAAQFQPVPQPAPVAQPAQPASKPTVKNGEDGLMENPLVISAVLAAFLLAIVLTFRHHQLQKQRRKAESEEPGDKEDRY